MSDRKKITKQLAKSIGRLASVHSNRYHVMPRSNKWIIRRDGAIRALGIYKTRNEAVKKVEDVVRSSHGGYAYIHGKDGRIVEEVTYFGD